MLSRYFALPILALLCGCNVPPVTPPLVDRVSPDRLGLAQAAGPQPSPEWWKSFGDPQLERLIEQALQSSPRLQAALARIRGAEAVLAGAESQTSPQADLDGQIQFERLSDEYVLPAPYGGSWRWVSDIQARMRWSLDFWGKQAAVIAQARSLASAQALDEAGARQAVTGAMAQAYLDLVLAWQNLDIARQEQSDRQTILDLVKSRTDAGLETDAMLEQAKARLAAADVDVSAAEADRDIGVHAVAALAGDGPGAYAGIARPNANLDAIVPLPKAIPADLLARRPDILAAQARISAALHGHEAARADFYPNIDLTAAFGLQAVGLGNLFGPSAITTGLGPAIHLPLFDAGKLKAQYAGTGAELDLAIAGYNDAVLSAVRQSADALTLIQSLTGRVQRQQAVLDSAGNALKLAEERYRLGLSDQIVVISAESLLLQARRQMAVMRALLAEQRVVLLLSVGGGFEPYQPQEAREEGTRAR